MARHRKHTVSRVKTMVNTKPELAILIAIIVGSLIVMGLIQLFT